MVYFCPPSTVTTAVKQEIPKFKIFLNLWTPDLQLCSWTELKSCWLQRVHYIQVL